MAANVLVLIKNEQCLTAVICQNSLKSSQVKAIFHQTFDDDLSNALLNLLKESQSAGFADAWKGSICVCLPASDGLFQDFGLPPASKRTAVKTVSLLLDSEIPFDSTNFIHKTVFIGNGSKKPVFSITTMIPEALMEKWKHCLAACGASSVNICLEPWPLIAGLGKLSAQALLISIDGNSGSICALNQKGQPLRIYPISPAISGQEQAQEIFNQCSMLLAGLAFQPSELLLYGTSGALKGLLEKQFNLPSRVIGQDIPLYGLHSRLGENEPVRLIAACISRQVFWRHWKMPVFVCKICESQKQLALRRMWLPAAAIFALFVAVGITFLLGALKRSAQSANLRELMAEQLVKALPDAPKNASNGRLKSILNSRISAMTDANGRDGSKKILQLFEEIHAATPAALDIDVHRLTLDEKHLRLYGSAGSFEDVNSFKEKLEDVGGITTSRIVNAANKNERQTGARVEFELDLTRDKI